MNRQIAQIKVLTSSSTDYHYNRQVFTPWYLNEEQVSVGYDEPNAKPIPFSEFPDVFHNLNPYSQNNIRNMQSQMVSQEGWNQATIIVSTLKVDETKYITLDGNHRTSSLLTPALDGKMVTPLKVVEYQIQSTVLDNLLPEFEFGHHYQNRK